MNPNDAFGVDEEAVLIEPDLHHVVNVAEVVVKW